MTRAKPITQRTTLAMVRKPLPPAKRVIESKRTKTRRKRAQVHPMDLLIQSGDWVDRAS